ncbi:hypothetical protein AVDCRST_MAG82-2760, partial [uncultured Rubrobacteraceae bacterium]
VRGGGEGAAGLQLRGGGRDVPAPRGLRHRAMAGEGELVGRTGLFALRSLHRRKGRGPRPASRDAKGRDGRPRRGGARILPEAALGERREANDLL